MKKKNSRGILRPGKGRAFLRFLVGEAVLLVVCACVYLFVLQGMIELPGVERLLKDNVSLKGFGTSDVLKPTVTPTLAPTPTPVPQALYSPQAELATLQGLNLVDSEWLKSSLFSFSEIRSEGVTSLAVKGHAYLEGMDAEKGSIYIVLQNPENGLYLAAWQAQPATAENYLSFDEANGVNLEQAYYQACVDATAYEGTPYQVCICVVNGARAGLTVLPTEAE